MSKTQNLLWAETAIAHTHKMLPKGVANPTFIGQHTSPDAGRSLQLARLDAKQMGNSTSARTAAAKWEGAGNCGEMARIALKKLKTLGASPLHLMHIPVINLANGSTINHTFVVIGGQNLSPVSGYPLGGSNCTQWGAEAVICDPWISLACAASNAHHSDWNAYALNAWYFDREEQAVANLPSKSAEAPF
ncbi:MAG: hypothetical protein AAGA16_09830 [Cyanobacteria bacterium P01_E01_bin.35]